MRVSRGGVCFRIAVTAFLFVLACAARGASSEALPPDFLLLEADMRRLLTANWLRVSTQNAGSLSLPPWWEIISKDEPVERGPEEDVMLHVQQVLYARSDELSADSGAELQVFSIWRADRKGKIFPLSDAMLKQINGDFVANLIDARYGNVAHVAKEVVYTKLDELSVVTYGAAPGDPSVDPRTLRYKRAALFYGDKQVLVLMKYSPDHEKYWQGELEMLLDIWVASLALTPRPLSEMAKALPIPLPEFPPEALPEIVPLPPRLTFVPNVPVPDPSAFAPISPGTLPKEEMAKSFVPPLTPAISVDSLPVLPSYLVSAQAQGSEADKREAGENTQRGPAERHTQVVPFLLSADHSPLPALNKPLETPSMPKTVLLLLCAMPPVTVGAFFKIARIQRRRGRGLFNEQDSMLTEPLLSADFTLAAPAAGNVSEPEEEIEDPTPPPEPGSEELVLSFLEEVSHLEEKAQECQIAESEKMGFDKVYSLLDEALLNIDSDLEADAVFAPRRKMPNLKETAEVLDGLEEMFGASCVMESLKDEVFKALEFNAGTPILQTKEVALDCSILKLCSGTLLRMLQTGRYHVGRGILGSEGQELLELFHRINGLRAQKSYSTPEETGRDSAFIQYCMGELG